MAEAIRVWLEPGYDHGRTGAWMLDWPGAFTWGETRDAALARVSSAVNRYVEWLQDHGEPTEPVPLGFTVVDEVAAHTLDDGYEINGTFDADDRPVTAADVDAVVRRLGYARDDLASLRRRIEEFIDVGGQLPIESRSEGALADGAAPGREADAVLRHVAGAETWFVSRLDPEARFRGTRDDLDAYLAESRQFLIDGLRRVQAATSQGGRVDSKGERWTLAKVLRRAQYHSLDHLDELDRRLTVAEGRVERVELRRNAELDAAELRRLFAAAGMTRRARDSDELNAAMVGGSTETVSAWDDGRLVGFGRIISDEATNGYISTVVVAPRWQDRGLGSRLMKSLMAGRERLKLTLDARAGAESFYERLGFEKVSTNYIRQRQE